jgi:hypothetical protein
MSIIRRERCPPAKLAGDGRAWDALLAGEGMSGSQLRTSCGGQIVRGPAGARLPAVHRKRPAYAEGCSQDPTEGVL